MGGVWCCKDCKKREIGCHSKCEKYLKQKEDSEELNKKIRKDKKFARATRDAVLWSRSCTVLKNQNHKK